MRSVNWNARMATKSNAVLSALANAVRLNPRLSAGLAFELGLMVGAFIKAARGRKGIAGAAAKLIEAAPLVSHTTAPSRAKKPRRKLVARKSRAAKRKAA